MKKIVLKVKDVCKLYNGRAYLMPELLDAGKYRIVRVGNFSGKDEWFYSDMELEPEKYCEKGDLLYKWACNFGPEIWNEEKVIYHYHIWKIKCNELIDKKFFYYYLKSITPYWLGGVNGSTMFHITKEVMERKKIYIPKEIKTQRKIAQLISNYDELIEKNNRRIQILEDMAEEIYKEWFVRFRFPEYKKTTFVDGVPEGWEQKRLKDILHEKTNNGVSKNERDKFDCYLPIDYIPNHSMSLVEIDKIDNAESSLQYFEKDDILYGAMRPYFHKVLLSPIKGITRTTCFVLEPNNEKYKYFAYLLLFQKPTVDFSTVVSVGSTMPYVRWKDFNRMNIIVPAEEIVTKFNKIIKPILKKLQDYYFENKNLSIQRDLLLPRLMSGKIDLTDKEIV